MNHIRLMRYERKDFHFWGADVPPFAVRGDVMIFEYAGVSIMVKRQLLSLLFAAGRWLQRQVSYLRELTSARKKVLVKTLAGQDSNSWSPARV